MNNSTVIITETGYGKFGKPGLIPYFWAGDLVIQFQPEMDLRQAAQLKEQAGYIEPFSNITLRNPLSPTKTNPYFIFGVNQKQPYIFVDTVTGKVTEGN